MSSAAFAATRMQSVTENESSSFSNVIGIGIGVGAGVIALVAVVAVVAVKLKGRRATPSPASVSDDGTRTSITQETLLDWNDASWMDGEVQPVSLSHSQIDQTIWPI
jgi:hypothetical protein